MMDLNKLQALVYDILPSTTAVFSCAIGSRKLLAKEQFFVGAQTVVSVEKIPSIKIHWVTDPPFKKNLSLTLVRLFVKWSL